MPKVILTKKSHKKAGQVVPFLSEVCFRFQVFANGIFNAAPFLSKQLYSIKKDLQFLCVIQTSKCVHSLCLSTDDIQVTTHSGRFH